jgi:hypothetical protein
LGVADLIAALFLVSSHPQDIVVLGVQPANTDWGTTLSGKVQAALAGLVDAALSQLSLWQQSPQASSETRASSVLKRSSPSQGTCASHEEGAT